MYYCGNLKCVDIQLLQSVDTCLSVMLFLCAFMWFSEISMPITVISYLVVNLWNVNIQMQEPFYSLTYLTDHVHCAIYTRPCIIIDCVHNDSLCVSTQECDLAMQSMVKTNVRHVLISFTLLAFYLSTCYLKIGKGC